MLFTTVDKHYNPTVTALAGMAKPVIAAVNGVAAGAGSSLAFACDLRIVADTAGFNLAFANVALSCDTGASYTLQRLVGRAKAIELLYFPSHHHRRRTRSSSGWRPRSSRPTSSPPRSAPWPPGSRPGRPSRSARCASRSPTPPVTPSRSRWSSRAR